MLWRFVLMFILWAIVLAVFFAVFSRTEMYKRHRKEGEKERS